LDERSGIAERFSARADAVRAEIFDLMREVSEQPTFLKCARIESYVGHIQKAWAAFPALYNLTSIRTTNCASLPLLGAERVPKVRLLSGRGIAVALVIFALTASLSTRVFHDSYSQSSQVQSSSSYQKVQHRDKDASEWVPPTSELSILWVEEASVTPETRDELCVRVHYESLYNRPPPTA